MAAAWPQEPGFAQHPAALAAQRRDGLAQRRLRRLAGRSPTPGPGADSGLGLNTMLAAAAA